MNFLYVFDLSPLTFGGQVSPGVGGRGGGDFAEMSRRPHRLRFHGKQPVKT